MVVFPERLLASGKKGGYLAQFSPVPSFSEYTGPYKVGTMDVEIPVADLESPCPDPEEAKNIGTVQFRVFYPAVAESNEKPITWLPNPQRHHISAYTKFVGVQSMVAEFLSFLPRHFYYTTIPVYKNAKMEEPQTSNGRWPTMIFSHGLGGSRNSYSYIAGSLASHGVVVFCPEHRDGSAIVSFVRTPSESGNAKTGKTRRIIPYRRISHDVTPEVYETREAQLRLRLWELGLTLDSVLALDQGAKVNNLNSSTTSMAHFAGRLDVNDPGSILFGGHSFGATAVYQLLKSTYYADVHEVANMGKPLFTPAADSEIRRQITDRSVIMLLDMWCVPLLAPNSAPLFNLPLPAYAKVPSAPGGKAILAVESEVFYKWSEHLHLKARILSPDPSAKVVLRDMFEGREGGASIAEPNFFYVGKSVHLSQSDFGVLFPWLTKKIFDAEQPERCLRLNLRAQLQFFRENGIAVADTNPADLIDGTEISESLSDGADKPFASTSDKAEEYDDSVILQQGVEDIDSWKWIDTIGLGDFKGGAADGKPLDEQVQETDKKIEAELEPGISADATAAVPVTQVSATAA